MMKIVDDWIPSVHLCHRHQAESVRARWIQQLRNVCEQADTTSPIRAIRDQQGNAVYAIHYPGRLVCIGGFSYANHPPSHVDQGIVAGQLRKLVSCLSENVEIVQAVLYESEHSAEAINDRQETLRLSGFRPLATLLQMERVGSFLNSSPSCDLEGSLSFEPWSEALEKDFESCIDGTYENTLDVPELNGIRSVSSTLAGYAAAIAGESRPWWLVRRGDKTAGCLLLCPHGSETVELVYVGLLPDFRNRGLSREILRFAHRWTQTSGAKRVVLAVDQQNDPAIRAYASFGYATIGKAIAWFWSPKL
jgi:GNAT superfamily N-acetyltransferase